MFVAKRCFVTFKTHIFVTRENIYSISVPSIEEIYKIYIIAKKKFRIICICA